MSHRRGVMACTTFGWAILLAAAGCSGGDGAAGEESLTPQPTAVATTTPDTVTPTPATVPTPATSTVGDLVDGSAVPEPLPVVAPDVAGMDLQQSFDVMLAAGLIPYAIDPIESIVADPTTPSTASGFWIVSSNALPGMTTEMGRTVFMEVGPSEPDVWAVNGDRLTGVTNGRQEARAADDATWVVTAFVTGEQTFRGRRELALSFDGGDLRCVDGRELGDLTALRPGAEIEFTLVDDPADDVARIAPTPARAAELVVACS